MMFRYVVSGVLLSLLAVAPVQAQPVADIYWNGCVGTGGVVGPPSTNVDFTNGFAPYQQFISIQGAEAPNGEAIFSHDVELRVKGASGTPDAWRFDAAGCMTANFSQIQYNSLGAAGCPGLRLGTEVPVTEYAYDGLSGESSIRAATAYPAGNPGNAAATLLLWQLIYGMAAADNPCQGASQPMCFALSRVEYFQGPSATNTSKQVAVINQSFVTFNDPSNALDCPGAVQNLESSWGKIKGLYR